MTDESGRHKKEKPALRNRVLFSKNDPLRDLHVPKKERLDEDGGPGSTARDFPDIDADDDFDRDLVRANMEVVPPEDLQ